MKMAAVTSLMKYYPLPEALRTIAEAGYTGVELWGGFPHAYTDDFFLDGWLDEAIVGRARRLIETSGLEPGNFLPEQCFSPVNFLVSNDKDLARVIDTFGALADVAERAGVVLVLEPLTFLETTAVETLDDLDRVLAGVGSPHLAAMLDTGHLNVTARALGLDPVGYLEAHLAALGDRVRHLHIDDNHGDLDAHLLPGQGSFDFKAGYAALRRSGYDDWLSAELMMFGDNPVPPKPGDLLRETRLHTERVWNA